MIIEFSGVSKTYDSGRMALKNVSFKMKEGEFIAVIGASGAGKSTLLRCINRLTDFDSGDIFFDGINIKNLKKHVPK